MGFSTQQYRKKQEERPWKINPVWRGIGCFLIILIPIMAWYAATLFLQSSVQIIKSTDLGKPITINYVHISEVDAIIADINLYTTSHQLTQGQFFYFILFMFLGFGILAFLYAVLYRMAGPSRYGPFDVPPNRM